MPEPASLATPAIWGKASDGLLPLNRLADAKGAPGNREAFVKERLEDAKAQLQVRERKVKENIDDIESGMEQNGSACDAKELFVVKGQLKNILENIEGLPTLDSVKELFDENLEEVLREVGDNLSNQFDKAGANQRKAQQAAQRKAQQAAQLAAPPVESKEGVLSAALGL